MLLSICIPTYNRPVSLLNCLNSIATQKNKNDFEVCISDNCSNDDLELFHYFSSTLQNSFIDYCPNYQKRHLD